VNGWASGKKSKSAIYSRCWYKLPLDKLPLDKLPLDKLPLDKLPLASASGRQRLFDYQMALAK
jgi:hypothetical protein